MRTKMLAAFIFFVACASGSAVHAGKLPPPEEFAKFAGWISRAGTAAEFKAMQNLWKLEPGPMVQPFSERPYVYEKIIGTTPGSRLQDGWSSQGSNTDKVDRVLPSNRLMHSEDQGPPILVDKPINWRGAAGAAGSGIVTGGGMTYCFLLNQCTGKP